MSGCDACRSTWKADAIPSYACGAVKLLMDKIDFKTEFKHLYKASAKEVVEVDVPEFQFLMIDGEGDPNTSERYRHAVEALYSVSYTVKFALKKEGKLDYTVMPLEGLWWADDMRVFQKDSKNAWKWTMMIMQPDLVSEERIAAAIASVQVRKTLPALGDLRFDTFKEGRSAQMLHVGPFSAEGPTIERVHDYIAHRGALAGKHHEIYLSDIHRASPTNWKTIIRQPMK